MAIAAVSLSAWFGGLGPGIACAALSIIGLDFFLIAPRYEFFSRPSDLLLFLIFSLLAFLISSLTESRIRSEIDLHEKTVELKTALAERIELTNQILQDRREFEMILNTLPGIVYEGVGSENAGEQRMAFISSYATEMLGYPPESWYKDENFWQKITHPDDWEDAVAKASLTYRQQLKTPVSFRCFTKDGEVRHLESYNGVITNERGERLRQCGVVMDATSRKEAELELTRYAEQLNRSNEELEQFAYVASHDLQEPLRMVISYLQLIERRYKSSLDDDGIEFIEFAVDGANRMKALINDLLEYSRVQRNHDEFEPVALDEAVQTVLHNLERSIENCDAQITYDKLPEISGNRRQIEQLLQNLLSNAIKFRGENRPEIQISAVRQEKSWLFAVADNGIGIESQYMERIFTIFQRLHTRDQYPGTGIGLAICKKIVEKHGGAIWLESTPGEGTTFYFTLPFAPGF